MAEYHDYHVFRACASAMITAVRLRAEGCRILAIHSHGGRPSVEIDSPTPALARHHGYLPPPAKATFAPVRHYARLGGTTVAWTTRNSRPSGPQER